MKKALLIALCLVSVVALAQKSTELYIPIGKSPGLSKEIKTVYGPVSEIRPDRSIVIFGYTVKFTDKSEVYLDRSKVKKQNTYGTFDDIKLKKVVEAYAPTNNVIQWIKIETTE
jgi:hypothetical protein